MIPKPLDHVTEDDLIGLVKAAVSEHRTIDYKREIQQLNDEGRRELLADVSSFANTAGGDLIFGMTETGGIPDGIPGISLPDPNQQVLQLDNIIRDGLDPRIRHATQAIKLANGQYVVIVRSEQSWYGPHRVIFKNSGRFWARTSNGKYELDVNELRDAFLLSNKVTERISAFRSERIIALQNGRGAVPLVNGPILVLHCLPLESFGSKRVVDVFRVLPPGIIQPIMASRLLGWASQINFDGVVCAANPEPSAAYTQVYRNGVIEAVRIGVLSTQIAPKVIPSLAFEEAVVTYVSHCFSPMKRLGLSPPLFIALSLIGVQGTRMALSMRESTSQTIDREVLVLPEVLVEDFFGRCISASETHP